MTPPKDGTMFVATFKNHPTPLATMWNGCRGSWVAATPHFEPVNDVWDDCYFESEFFEDELLTWWPIDFGKGASTPDPHELWAAAQLTSNEGIEDGVRRVKELLK